MIHFKNKNEIALIIYKLFAKNRIHHHRDICALFEKKSK